MEKRMQPKGLLCVLWSWHQMIIHLKGETAISTLCSMTLDRVVWCIASLFKVHGTRFPFRYCFWFLLSPPGQYIFLLIIHKRPDLCLKHFLVKHTVALAWVKLALSGKLDKLNCHRSDAKLALWREEVIEALHFRAMPVWILAKK